MARHYFHLHGLSVEALAMTVAVSYVLSALAVVVMVVHGFRRRTYAMPPISTMAMLSICAICVWGPFSNQSHLFYEKTKWPLLLTWGLDGALIAVILGQFLAWGRGDIFGGLPRAWFYGLIAVTLGTIASGLWSFIVFYQDYYVNEICPLVMLVMAAEYVHYAYASPGWKGISASVAWLLALSNLLLFSAVVLGNMADPYPEAEYGYGFIYWVYALTLLLNFLYARRAMAVRRTAAA